MTHVRVDAFPSGAVRLAGWRVPFAGSVGRVAASDAPSRESRRWSSGHGGRVLGRFPWEAPARRTGTTACGLPVPAPTWWCEEAGFSGPKVGSKGGKRVIPPGRAYSVALQGACRAARLQTAAGFPRKPRRGWSGKGVAAGVPAFRRVVARSARVFGPGPRRSGRPPRTYGSARDARSVGNGQATRSLLLPGAASADRKSVV